MAEMAVFFSHQVVLRWGQVHLYRDPAQFIEIPPASTGNNSAPDPEIAGFRGCDSLTFKVDLLLGAGHTD